MSIASLPCVNPADPFCLAAKATVSNVTSIASRVVRPSREPRVRVEVEALTVARRPEVLLKRRTQTAYAKKFAALTDNTCIECRPEDARAVAGSLRFWLRSQNVQAVVHRDDGDADGIARVWFDLATPSITPRTA